MQFKKLIDEERAVSPVIGVILMVAITVILAAVIGTFVLGLGDQVQSTTPQASFGFDSSNMNGNTDTNADDQVTITHESGDSLQQSDINVKIGGTTVYQQGTPQTGASGWDTGDTISAGDQLTYDESVSGATTFSGETTIRVIYNNPNSDSSSTLATQTYTFDSS